MPSLSHNETHMLWKICSDLKKHRAGNDKTAIRHDIEELEAMVMHSDNVAIRSRARAAIEAADLSIGESNVLPFPAR